MMNGPRGVALAAEQAAVDWLAEDGWTITQWDTRSPGSTHIEARTSSQKLLVRVKGAAYPDIPKGLTFEEEEQIRTIAKRMKAEAWEAKVWLDRNLDSKSIVWRKLG